MRRVFIMSAYFCFVPTVLSAQQIDNTKALDLVEYIQFNNIQELEKALDQGLDVNASLDYLGNTLIHQACFATCDRHEIVELLIQRGADLSRPLSTDSIYSDFDDALTPLHMACRTQNLRCVQVLIKHNADVNAVTPRGYRPLIGACLKSGNGKIIEALLDAGALVNVKTRSGDSPISLLQEMSRRENVEHILELLKQKKEEQRICSVCLESTNKKCVGCEQSYYCSRKCQKKDWRSHKEMCQIFWK